MFEFAGRTGGTTTIGYVADFCPMCRVPQAFTLLSIDDPGGPAPRAGASRYWRKCEGCGVELEATHSAYASVSAERASVQELTARTFPRLMEACRPAMESDERARRSPMSLTAPERRALVLRPMLLLAPMVEHRFASVRIDRELVYAALAIVVGIVAASYGLRRLAPSWLNLALFAILFLGIGLFVWQLLASRRRYMRREILPRLAASLRPLSPTHAEINVAIDELRRSHRLVGSKLDAKQLRSALA